MCVCVCVCVFPAGCGVHLSVCDPPTQPGGCHPGQEHLWPARPSMPDQHCPPTDTGEEMVSYVQSLYSHYRETQELCCTELEPMTTKFLGQYSSTVEVAQ